MKTVIAFSPLNESIQFDRWWPSSVRLLAPSTFSQARFSLSEPLCFIRRLKPTTPQQQEAGRELYIIISVYSQLWDRGVYRLKEPSAIPQPHWDSRPSLLWPRKVPQSCSPMWLTHGLTLSSSQVLSGGRKGQAALADQPLGGGNACALGPAGASSGSAPHSRVW